MLCLYSYRRQIHGAAGADEKTQVSKKSFHQDATKHRCEDNPVINCML